LASIIIGILIGDKSGMDGRVIEDFQNANLSHLIAVSGAHFIYVVGFLEYICKFLKNFCLYRFSIGIDEVAFSS